MHRHSGIAFMTPEDVRYCCGVALTEKRAVTLDIAFAAVRFPLESAYP